MKWRNFLDIFGRLPLIDTELVYSGTGNIASLSVQISRWRDSKHLLQLRRGLYMINEPYRKVNPYEPSVACELVRPSYISLEKSLEMHNLIPEAIYTFTLVTTKRPMRYKTPIGIFDYRFIREDLFWGYQTLHHQNQSFFWATPEKTLLDYFYFKSGPVTADVLTELRIQGLDKIDPEKLVLFAKQFQKPKIMHAADEILKFRETQMAEEKML